MTMSLPGMAQDSPAASQERDLREAFSPRGLFWAREVDDNGHLEIEVAWRSRLRLEGPRLYLTDPKGIESEVSVTDPPPTWNVLGRFSLFQVQRTLRTHPDGIGHLTWPVTLLQHRFVWEDVREACIHRDRMDWLVDGTYRTTPDRRGLFAYPTEDTIHVHQAGADSPKTIRMGVVQIDAASVAALAWDSLYLLEAL